MKKYQLKKFTVNFKCYDANENLIVCSIMDYDCSIQFTVENSFWSSTHTSILFEEKLREQDKFKEELSAIAQKKLKKFRKMAIIKLRAGSTTGGKRITHCLWDISNIEYEVVK